MTWGHAETDTNFLEGSSYFYPQPVTQQQFSNDLVRVLDFGDQSTCPTWESTGAERFALYSVAGEPLQFSYQPSKNGIARQYHTPAIPTYYELRDTNDVLVTNAEFPYADGQWHSMAISVPTNGAYFLFVDDCNNCWDIKPSNIRLAFALPGAQQGAAVSVQFWRPVLLLRAEGYGKYPIHLGGARYEHGGVDQPVQVHDERDERHASSFCTRTEPWR